MNLIVIGIFAFNANGVTGAILQMVNHGVVSLAAFLLIGLVELRAGTDRFRVLGGLANGRPVMSTVLLIAALWALAVPGLGHLRLRALHPDRRVPAAGRARRRGGLRDRARGHVHAALVLGARPRGRRREASPPTRPTCASRELAIAVPLILILFAMTAYPWGVMQRVTTSQVAFDTPAKVQQL